MMMKNGANLAHLLANNHNKPPNLTTVTTPYLIDSIVVAYCDVLIWWHS